MDEDNFNPIELCCGLFVSAMIFIGLIPLIITNVLYEFARRIFYGRN